MDRKTFERVQEYVYKNYKSYEGKELIIKENDACFFILKHKDASPLILGKGILD
jgi:hypothetical protein